MTLYRLSGSSEFVAPVLVAAFDGWVDAAGAATASASHIASGGEVIATFDDDALFDLRARRPVLDIVDGTLTDLQWPDIVLRRVQVGSRDGVRDLLVLNGAEPDFRWRQLGQEIQELALKLGVVEWVSLGAIPAAVAHTRPVPVLATASKTGLLKDGVQQGPDGLLRVPSAALSAIEMSVSNSGIPSVGFYAQVPHYVAGPYAAASIALIEQVGRHLDVSFDVKSLDDEATEQRSRLDNLVEAQPDAQAYLERLESLPGDERIPSGDEIATEIERFLRESGGESPNPFEEG